MVGNIEELLTPKSILNIDPQFLAHYYIIKADEEGKVAISNVVAQAPLNYQTIFNRHVQNPKLFYENSEDEKRFRDLERKYAEAARNKKK